MQSKCLCIALSASTVLFTISAANAADLKTNITNSINALIDVEQFGRAKETTVINLKDVTTSSSAEFTNVTVRQKAASDLDELGTSIRVENTGLSDVRVKQNNGIGDGTNNNTKADVLIKSALENSSIVINQTNTNDVLAKAEIRGEQFDGEQSEITRDNDIMIDQLNIGAPEDIDDIASTIADARNSYSQDATNSILQSNGHSLSALSYIYGTAKADVKVMQQNAIRSDVTARTTYTGDIDTDISQTNTAFAHSLSSIINGSNVKLNLSQTGIRPNSEILIFDSFDVDFEAQQDGPAKLTVKIDETRDLVAKISQTGSVSYQADIRNSTGQTINVTQGQPVNF